MSDDLRDPGELVTIARSQLQAAYAAVSVRDLEAAYELFDAAGRLCAEACRWVMREQKENAK